MNAYARILKYINLSKLYFHFPVDLKSVTYSPENFMTLEATFHK